MELEYFIKKEDEVRYFDYWVSARVAWWHKIGVKKIKLLQQKSEELSHYSSATTDIVFEFPHGTEELEGIANRGDFDLGSHTKAQEQFAIKANVKENKESVDKLCMHEEGGSFIPNLIETSAGLDRAFLAVLASAYCVEKVNENDTRVVLKFHPALSPIKAAVIPLARNKTELVELARKVFETLKGYEIFPILLEAGGNIGKCYRKHDEIGTPFCITVDFDSLETGKVTVRDRDTMQQEHIAIDDLASFLISRIKL